MNNSVYIFFFLLTILTLRAQTLEVEPNGGCESLGIINITSLNGPFSGTTSLSDGDNWRITPGSSGSSTITITSGPGVNIRSISFSDELCSDPIMGSGTAWLGFPLTINLDETRIYYLMIAYSGDQDNSPYSFTVTGGSILPVELTIFTATLVDKYIELNWETATEVNNYGFEIQRSLENTNWKNIGFVNGAGNSNTLQRYKFVDNAISTSSNFKYRLKQLDNDGTFEFSPIIEVVLGNPESYELAQNYPNPFNPTTTIKYSIPKQSNVILKVFDVLGNEIAELVNEPKPPGTYEIEFSSHSGEVRNLPSGVYFYKLQAGEFTAIKKMLLVK